MFLKILDNMKRFFLNGYPSDSFKLKDDCLAYLILDKTLTKSSNKIHGLFDELLERQELITQYELDKTLKYIPKKINGLIKSLILNSSSLYFQYEDFKEEMHTYKINKSEFCSNLSLDYFIKKYKYQSDKGFCLYENNDEWAYFYGENLYEGIGELETWESFHLFVVKKSFQKVFLQKIQTTIKNELTFEKFLDINIVTKDNDKVYKISFSN